MATSLRDRIVATGLALMGLSMATDAKADAVDDWRDRAVVAAYIAHQPLGMQGRAVSIVDLAMFEALNAITPRYKTYLSHLNATPQASAQVAVAVAAHDVLVKLYQPQAAALDQALATVLDTVVDDAQRRDGSKLCARAAAALLFDRRGDGSKRPDNYRPATMPGLYVLTVLPASY